MSCSKSGARQSPITGTAETNVFVDANVREMVPKQCRTGVICVRGARTGEKEGTGRQLLTVVSGLKEGKLKGVC